MWFIMIKCVSVVSGAVIDAQTYNVCHHAIGPHQPIPAFNLTCASSQIVVIQSAEAGFNPLNCPSIKPRCTWPVALDNLHTAWCGGARWCCRIGQIDPPHIFDRSRQCSGPRRGNYIRVAYNCTECTSKCYRPTSLINSLINNFLFVSSLIVMFHSDNE